MGAHDFKYKNVPLFAKKTGTRASFGAADIEVLIFPGFQAKRGTLLYLKSWAPI